ncbi:MAG: hypothetical protein PHY64_11940 [Eubacteriales bacterium]|nr:hypothetical protein [Eubacteriales bacterium]
MSKKINGIPKPAEPSISAETSQPAATPVFQCKPGKTTVTIIDAKGRKIKVFNVRSKGSLPSDAARRVLYKSGETFVTNISPVRCLSFDPPIDFPPMPLLSKRRVEAGEPLSPSEPPKR